LIIGGILRAVVTSPNRLRAAALASACVILVGASGYAVVKLGGSSEDADHRHGDGSSHALAAAREASQTHDIGASAEDMRLALHDSHPAVRARAVLGLAAAGDKGAAAEITAMLKD